MGIFHFLDLSVIMKLYIRILAKVIFKLHFTRRILKLIKWFGSKCYSQLFTYLFNKFFHRNDFGTLAIQYGAFLGSQVLRHL